MKASELRNKFLTFFKDRGHTIIDSASLIPENDPTCLFTTAGMHPLVPYLLGEDHPGGSRVTNVQKCVRTGDIEEVGDDVHLTFFEMLGNWSFGDYFKKEAINWSFEFLTGADCLNLPMEKLAVSVFAGDEDAPFDEEAYNIWSSLGFAAGRIAKLGKKDNWWGPAGQTGPCGPDTEMFYWVGDEPAPETFDPENKLWVEIWNDVFMQYNKTADGKYVPLEQTNVDTGMGVERVTAILQGKSTPYETVLFTPLFDKLAELATEPVDSSCVSARIVVEHIRSATFMLSDGVVPGNVDQAYVLRRLIRRAVNEARKLGVEGPFASAIAEVVIENYGEFYTELERNRAVIVDELQREEQQFKTTLEKGLKEFNKMIKSIPPHIVKKVIGGRKAFNLYETYGFPLELTIEMAEAEGFTVDIDGYNKAFKKHQELSRKGAEQKFKGGLADQSEQSARLHTATHLLHEALRQVLGDHVAQKGSNITADRLRFDFTHSEKMTPEQVKQVEDLVNEQIEAKQPISFENVTVEEAKAQGAIGLFEAKYGEVVKMYSIGSFSKEICGGPHAANTGDLGLFKIKKEQSSSRGVRRIKAVLLPAETELKSGE